MNYKYLTKNPDGTIGAEGMFFEADEVVCDKLGWCGCGMPNLALDFLRSGLIHIESIREVWDKKITWDEYHERQIKLFGSEGAAYVFFYMLDKEGLTEHGGSVPGWLSPKGIELLEVLNEYEQYMKDNPDA